MRSLTLRLGLVLAFLTVLVLAVSVATSAQAQNCSPAGCDSFHVVTFESKTTGASVEGIGAVDPDLIIHSRPWPLGPSCPTGSAKVIQVGLSSPYASYSSGATDNACLDGAKGFGDSAECVLDYDFTFTKGISVSCFAIRILDYGDYFPYGGTNHQVFLTAYDASGYQVDQAILTVTGGETNSGDACVSQAGSGNYILKVGGSGIRKVSLTYDAFADPNVGYDDIAFCKEPLGVQICTATCDSLHVVTFEAKAAGDSVEGLGVVDPDLAIHSLPWTLGPSCAAGTAKVIQTGNSSPYASFSSGATDNACLDGTKGFGDDQNCVLNYEFTFRTGVSVSCFSIRMLDYGDYFPYGGTNHQAFLTAYDISGHQVDQAILTVTGGETSSGDACVVQAGSPGNYFLRVSGSGIRRVLLTYDAFPDPNVGYDDITFCKETVGAQSCPAACDSIHRVTFESNMTGASVEGLGAMDPVLAITSVPWMLGPSCPTGSAKVIETGTSSPYASFSSGVTDNACLDGTKGFGDDQNCVLNYDFTFAPGVAVSCFAIRILDYGDYFPYGGTSHKVHLTAYNASNQQVDEDILTVTGGETLDGDACVSQSSRPGNYVMRVGGSGIRKVSLTYDDFPDPNVGYDDIVFCQEARVASVGSAPSPRQLMITEIRPNPLAERTAITFTTPVRGSVKAQVFDLMGRLVAELSPGAVAPGIHSIAWNGRNMNGARVHPGVYLIRLSMADQNATARVILVY